MGARAAPNRGIRFRLWFSYGLFDDRGAILDDRAICVRALGPRQRFKPRERLHKAILRRARRAAAVFTDDAFG
jgi:hypothetical protein